MRSIVKGDKQLKHQGVLTKRVGKVKENRRKT
jgi:hypothetical protein